MFSVKTAFMVFLAVLAIVFCIMLAVGASAALFSDTVDVNNHLKAGSLDVELWRTDLDYSVFNENGDSVVLNVPDDINLSSSDVKNAFGIDFEKMRIAPGSYFDADLELRNSGNVDFDYSVQIKLISNENSNEIAKQIKVTITKSDGTESEYFLSDLAIETEFLIGTMAGDKNTEAFSVKVEFLDVESDSSVESQSVEFDLMVIATQNISKTKQ